MSVASPDDKNPKSRLDQELDEILTKSGANELKAPPRPQLRSIPGGAGKSSRSLPSAGWFLIGSIVCAVLAVVVSDTSQLLANLLIIGAVACFVTPIVQQFRKSGESAPTQKMWRGQYIELEPERPSPIDSVRRWWQSRSGR